MLINKIDTEDFNATLLDREIQNAEIITYDDWLDEKFDPDIEKQVFKYSYVRCEFLIECSNDDLAEKSMSNLIKESSRAKLEFQDLTNHYKGVLEEHEKEKITIGKFSLILTWKCGHSSGDYISTDISRKNNIGITLDGNLETPAVLEITPITNLEFTTIIGFGEDITLKNLTVGSTIIIDGEKGLVTENGQNKFPDYDSWGFPKLSPGVNNITIDTDTLDIVVKYKPRWI